MAVKFLTEAEFEAQWGTARVTQLADRDGDGCADDGVVEAAILDAESRAESKLLTRYAPGDLPTTTGTTSAALKRIVGGLALWYLCKAHQLKGEDVRDAYSDAMKELDDITRGNASLLLAGNPDVDVSAPQVLAIGGVEDGEKGTFTRETMEDW